MSRLHLAGIVPVANLKCDFDLPIPDILLPVSRGFTAIQKAVFECSMAGCNTIWIVANDDLAPVIRQTVGEWVYDPVYYRRPSARSSEERREIPIYYVPIHPKDRDRRDSYAWSILYGIHSAWRVSYAISRWVVPEKYYVSFHGLLICFSPLCDRWGKVCLASKDGLKLFASFLHLLGM